MNAKVKLFSLALLIIIVGVLIYSYHTVVQKGQEVPGENMTVSNFDVSKPAVGFPAGIPLDQKTIVEQKELDYPDQGAALYVVSYRSGLQLEELYSEYKKFFSANGFTVVSSAKGATSVNMEITKGGDHISVNITVNQGFNLVNLAVLHKK